MSNLVLPNMSFENLRELARGSSLDKPKKIAYQTYVVLERRQYVHVIHHRSIVATLSSSFVSVSNGGWSSRTTSARLHKILVDNNTNFRCNIKAGEMVVTHLDNPKECYPVPSELKKLVLERN